MNKSVKALEYEKKLEVESVEQTTQLELLQQTNKSLSS